MILLLDTNVILDWLLERDEYHADALSLLNLSFSNKAVECATASSITDINYLIERELGDKKQAQELLKQILTLITILPVTQSDIESALFLEWSDFEDAVQYVVAKANGADYIITRDQNFKTDDIPVYSPKEFLEKVAREGIMSQKV